MLFLAVFLLAMFGAYYYHMSSEYVKMEQELLAKKKQKKKGGSLKILSRKKSKLLRGKNSFLKKLLRKKDLMHCFQPSEDKRP